MFDTSFGRNLLATVAVVLLAAGCGGGGSTSAPTPASDLDPSQILTVTIRNDQTDVARVNLWINGVRQRLGEVRGLQSQTFQVPMQRTNPVRMSFDMTLGRSCVTRDVVLSPGETVEVRIPVNLSMMQAVCSGG